MKFPIYQIDAFASAIFAGNPAAVVVLSDMLEDSLMGAIAAENNLPETAFIVLGEDTYSIRWFTPTTEVNLCGHATLAAAHVVFNYLGHTSNIVSFSSKSGLLTVRQEQNQLYLNFPTDTLTLVDSDEQLMTQLKSALGITPTEIYRGRDDVLVILNEEKNIAGLAPNMDKLKDIPARGVIVSAKGDNADFVSRFFAPQSGIPEDPVTGSAHTTLVPYWSKKLDKSSLKACQLSKRGGQLTCQYLGDRVEIGGYAQTYLVGEIQVN